MAGKRVAGYDLNADNWDKEDEPEDRGVFRSASESELKNRVIKKAKRKVGNSSEEGGKLGAFASFTGFGKTTSASTTLSATDSSPFSFLSKISTASSITSGQSLTTTVLRPSPKRQIVENESPTKNGDSKPNEGYYAKLKGLNLAVLDWIQSHLDKNPLVILSPIFEDYDKHLKEIQKSSETDKDKVKILSDLKLSSSTKQEGSKFTFGIRTNEKSPLSSETEPDIKSNLKSGSEIDKNREKPFSFGAASTAEGQKSSTSFEVKPFSKDQKLGFSFGSTLSEKSQKSTLSATETKSSEDNKSGVPFTPTISEASNKPSFSFRTKGIIDTSKSASVPIGSTADNNDGKVKTSFSFGSTGSTSTGFSFSGAKPFSFSGVTATAASSTASDTQKEDEDETDEPPKVEFTQVEESDSIYSKKCKVFVKNEEKYGDRGVGTLHLKPVKNKVQLIVRADTNLGNLLLNMLLNESVPTKRIGKKDVLLVGLPMPSDKKPTQILIRVKTEEEADQLLETLEKYKKTE